MENHIALYRKYRPQLFTDLVGQQAIQIVGEDALRLKRGELAIGAKGKRIVLIETGKK